MAYKSKRGGLARFWAVFMTILLAASIFFGIVTEGFKNWDASTWFKKDAEKGTVIDGDGNEMNGDTVYNMPSNMVFRPALRGATPATSVTIKAVIEPLDATNQLVDWTIAFADPASEWASGKTLSDYVTITDTSELTTVTFKQAFGEQIIITVTSQDNPEYTDTCTVDCSQKLGSAYVTYAAGAGLEGDTIVTLNNATGTASNWAIFKAYLSKDGQKAASFTYNTTEVYTIEDTYTTTVSIAPSAALLAEAKKINASAVSGSYDASAGITANTDFFAQLLGTDFATVPNLYELGKVLDKKGVAQPFVVTVTTTSTYTEDVTDTYYLAYAASSIGKAVTRLSAFFRGKVSAKVCFEKGFFAYRRMPRKTRKTNVRKPPKKRIGGRSGCDNNATRMVTKFFALCKKFCSAICEA